MRRLVQSLAVLALIVLIWPEFARYRTEYRLVEAVGRLERALTGKDQGATALASVAEAQRLAHAAAATLPGDARPVMLEGIALILGGRPADAVRVLEAGIAAGERPEFTINLGRARSALGDEVGAHAALLRSAWASPAAIVTLPKPMQASLLEEVRRLETELRAGRMTAVPPLTAPP